MSLRVFAWGGELFGAENKEEVRRIAASAGCLSRSQMTEPITECPGSVRVVELNGAIRTRHAKDLIKDGYGGWLIAGDPA